MSNETEKVYQELIQILPTVPLHHLWNTFIEKYIEQDPYFLEQKTLLHIESYFDRIHMMIKMTYPLVYPLFLYYLNQPNSFTWCNGHRSSSIHIHQEKKEIKLQLIKFYCDVETFLVPIYQRFDYHELSLEYYYDGKKLLFNLILSFQAQKSCDITSLSKQLDLFSISTCFHFQWDWNSFQFENQIVKMALSSDRNYYTQMDLKQFIQHQNSISTKLWFMKRNISNGKVYAGYCEIDPEEKSVDTTLYPYFPLHTILLDLDCFDFHKYTIRHNNTDTLDNRLSNLQKVETKRDQINYRVFIKNINSCQYLYFHIRSVSHQKKEVSLPIRKHENLWTLFTTLLLRIKHQNILIHDFTNNVIHITPSTVVYALLPSIHHS